MASMIPDSCPAKATQGEKLVFDLIRRGLPDDATAWYEPAVRGRHPDFVVLGPALGLFVFEVKGWFPKQIQSANSWDVELTITREGQSHTEKHKNPVRQARDYMFGTMDAMAREPLLRQPGGPHQGKLCFPCGFCVVFTNLTRHHLDDAGLSPLFPPDQVLCKDDLEGLQTYEAPASLAKLVDRCLPVRFPFLPLTKDQCRTVTGVLHPEVVVRDHPATAKSLPKCQPLPAGSRVLDVLDREQELTARAIGDGHRILFGVAGSGKTAVLLSRLRLLHYLEPDRRILLLCYNRSLAAHLSHLLGPVGHSPG